MHTMKKERKKQKGKIGAGVEAAAAAAACCVTGSVCFIIEL